MFAIDIYYSNIPSFHGEGLSRFGPAKYEIDSANHKKVKLKKKSGQIGEDLKNYRYIGITCDEAYGQN